jgi:predicted small secreted protein
MRTTRALAILLALGLAAACSRNDRHDVGSDLKGAGHDVSAAAAKVAHDPDVRAAGDQLKAAGHDVGKEIRKAAGQAKAAAHDVASDTRKAGHDVTHDTKREKDDNS